MGEMPVESSRGCWFGQKSHCTFCGIDDETLRYRVKSAPVVASQLDELHKRYNVSIFRFSDYIMPLGNFQEFLPEMVRRGSPYRFHYESKANLTEAQIELCASAGIRFLQPGIESFSSRVLKLMCKGVSAAQNIFTLYTMVRHGIFSFYNLIFGFPFEAPSDYEEMATILPALYHLIPPQSTVPVLVTRYAPLAGDPSRFGSNPPLRAHWRYDVIFSDRFRRLTGLESETFCYYYESPYREFGPELRVAHSLLQHQVAKWKDRYQSRKARLVYRDNGDGVEIEDSRLQDDPRIYRFGAVHRTIGEIMRAGITSWARLFLDMSERGIGETGLASALDDLLQNRIAIQVDKQLVWLALPEGALENTCVGLHHQNTDLRRVEDWPDRQEEYAGSPLDLPSKRELRTLPVIG
jgi:ribosomal peptide maturation radical SAM protein 1